MARATPHICICVPARNEAELLPGLFAALEAQAAAPPFALCLHLDGCTDDSDAVAAELTAGAGYPVTIGRSPAGGEPNAGRARRAAMRLGEAQLESLSAGVLLTTDADSAPAPDWVASALRSLEQADVTAGRIVRMDADRTDLQARVEAYYDRLYLLRRRIDPLPWETGPLHHCTGGANLAFRAEAYAALGGFAEHASGEDGRLIDAAHRLGLRVRRDARVLVHTSGRRVGRAPDGLAAALRRLEASDAAADLLVAHPEDACWQYERHAAARRAFELGITAAAARRLAVQLGKCPEHVREFAGRQPNAEAFATCIVPEVPGGPRQVGLPEAERLLALRERSFEAVAA